jgi:hypothetical protein
MLFSIMIMVKAGGGFLFTIHYFASFRKNLSLNVFFMKKVLLSLLIVLVLAVFAILQPVDFKPLKEQGYAQRSLEAIKAFEPPAIEDTLRGNWASASLIPPFPVAMAGYGDREGAYFNGIRDSLAVRAFVFHSAKGKYALLNADLLIIPPLVYQALEEKLQTLGWNMDQVYLSATHTHGGPGGWQPGPIGKMFAGDFQQQAVDFLASQMVSALRSAERNPEVLYIADTTLYIPEGVVNRLVGDEGTIEPRLDLMLLKKASGAEALIYTYAAHATTLGPEEMRLHGDYPSITAGALKKEVELVAYAAGAVGSMGPKQAHEDAYANEKDLGLLLAERINRAKVALQPTPLQAFWVQRFPIDLGKSQWRIGQKIAIRPWLFEALFGKVEATLSVMRMGETLWIGYPADISGELSIEWPDEGRPIFTSFNGSYAGYFTHDRHYSLNSYETRMMNWFGPYKGAYVQLLAEEVYKRYGELKP